MVVAGVTLLAVFCEAQAAVNLALGRPTAQSTTAYGGLASRGVDGNLDGAFKGDSCTHTAPESAPWWRVDLGQSYMISHVKVVNRAKGDCMANTCYRLLAKLEIRVGNDVAGVTTNPLCAYHPGYVEPGGLRTLNCAQPVCGRYLSIRKAGWTVPTTLALCEVQAFQATATGGNHEAFLHHVANDKLLTGHVIQAHVLPSPIGCASQCLATPSCLSYNVMCAGGTCQCEINAQRNAGALTSRARWLYFEMGTCRL